MDLEMFVILGFEVLKIIKVDSRIEYIFVIINLFMSSDFNC